MNIKETGWLLGRPENIDMIPFIKEGDKSTMDSIKRLWDKIGKNPCIISNTYYACKGDEWKVKTIKKVFNDINNDCTKECMSEMLKEGENIKRKLKAWSLS